MWMKSEAFPRGPHTTLRFWKRLVAYLSNRLDPVTVRWTAWIKAIVASILLVKEADKLTSRQLFLAALLRSSWGGYLRNGCLMSGVGWGDSIPSPASGATPHLVPQDASPQPCKAYCRTMISWNLCMTVLQLLTLSTKNDLTPHWWYQMKYGSSFVQDGIRYAGVVIQDKII